MKSNAFFLLTLIQGARNDWDNRRIELRREKPRAVRHHDSVSYLRKTNRVILASAGG